MQEKELIDLLRKYKLGTATDTERAMLESWYNIQAGQRRPISQTDVQDRLQQIVSQLPLGEGKRRVKWPLFAAAAAILVAIGASLLFFVQFKGAGPSVKPGGNKALLVANDGRSVQLREDKKGIVMAEHLIYDDGSAIANWKKANVEDTHYTIITPRGGQYRVVLADGSKVWLNSGSSLKYPVHFDDSERRVELTGEGYFEVKKSESGVPFLVSTSTQDVEVLGTAFNINAYADEPDTRTTLIEGSVKVSVTDHSTTLMPGQQAIVSPSGIRKADVDTSSLVAWKNGVFAFEGTDLQNAMRQISRWYGVDIIYQGNQPKIEVFARIRRDNSLNDVLVILNEAGINFKLQRKGRNPQLIVLP